MASNGGKGKGVRRHGANGEPANVLVPPGTIIKDAETGEIIKDFSEEEEGTDWVFLAGGRGGQGNWHFRTARHQAPMFAQPGMPGETRELILELNLIADIGLVGFPNAGKSSLLKAMTNANPKIAPYPFTTKIPNLGVFRIMDRDIVIADIPGLIEGASQGAGLGFQFLKHISRTKCLAFLLDLGDEDPAAEYRTLCAELAAYAPELVEKRHLIIGTKTDLEGTEQKLADLKKALPAEEITGMSSYSGAGLEDLRKAFIRLTEK
jgi:GTP-binding protein